MLIGLLIFSYSDYHLVRNKYNKLPIGKLSEIKEKTYSDEDGSIWELQPNYKNEFHQPGGIIYKRMPMDLETPYSILENPPKIDLDYPNLKLLCLQNDGSSYEAILRPDNQYVVTGEIRGTYNYASPFGILGNIKHTFLDVIPHFICSDYE